MVGAVRCLVKKKELGYCSRHINCRPEANQLYLDKRDFIAAPTSASEGSFLFDAAISGFRYPPGVHLI